MIRYPDYQYGFIDLCLDNPDEAKRILIKYYDGYKIPEEAYNDWVVVIDTIKNKKKYKSVIGLIYNDLAKIDINDNGRMGSKIFASQGSGLAILAKQYNSKKMFKSDLRNDIKNQMMFQRDLKKQYELLHK